MPDLVVTVIAAPDAPPCSASMLPATMLTESMVSAGGMYIWWVGRNAFWRFVPSVRVVLAAAAWPFTLKLIERCGSRVSEFGMFPGRDPGTRLISA